MIERYEDPEMKRIWGDDHKYQIWMDIEKQFLIQMVKANKAPESHLTLFKSKARINKKRMAELEETLKHDVLAFVTMLSEQVGEASASIHRGMTSSDVVDTTLSIQLLQSHAAINSELQQLIEQVRMKADQYRYAPCVGRTHGIHAEPMTFGIKLLSFFCELKRRMRTLREAANVLSFGKISGPVGTYSMVTPEMEQGVLDFYNLRSEPVSTQIIPRDRHAQYLSALALLATAIERLAMELRHLQRTEVSEVYEDFSSGQKGSSSMPHKRNPISAENLCGLARVVRSHSTVALENVPLWHERDISHSSAERLIFPDACGISFYMVKRARKLMEKLVFDERRAIQNSQLTNGAIHSARLLTLLVENGMNREQAYAILQDASKEGQNFEHNILENADVKLFVEIGKVRAIFNTAVPQQTVDLIFERAMKE